MTETVKCVPGIFITVVSAPVYIFFSSSLGCINNYCIGQKRASVKSKTVSFFKFVVLLSRPLYTRAATSRITLRKPVA
jgi:hypothetical protein